MKDTKLFCKTCLTSTLALAGLLGSAASWADVESATTVALSPNSRLIGSFGFQAQGYFGANFDPVSQQTTGAVAERVGVYTFDGEGNCKIHSIANKAGLDKAVFQDSQRCKYVVYADGTGIVNAVVGGKSFNTFFVLVNRDQEFMFTRREGISTPAEQGGASLIFGIGKKQ